MPLIPASLCAGCKHAKSTLPVFVNVQINSAFDVGSNSSMLGSSNRSAPIRTHQIVSKIRCEQRSGALGSVITRMKLRFDNQYLAVLCKFVGGSDANNACSDYDEIIAHGYFLLGLLTLVINIKHNRG